MKKRMIAAVLAACMLLFSVNLTAEASAKSLDEEAFEEIVVFVKEKMDAGEFDTKEEIRRAIEEGEKEFGVELTDSTEEVIVSAGILVQKLGLDSDTLVRKAQEVYDTYGESIAENLETILEQELQNAGAAVGDILKEQLVEPMKEAALEAVKASAKNFVSDLKNSVVNFVKNIFHI